MRSICAGDVEGPRYSRTSIMRAETGHGCGLQMILKHNFNQVCSADCLTHHADSRRLRAVGMAFAVRTRNQYLRHTMCFSLRRLRLLSLPTSVSPIRWLRTDTMPLDRTSRGDVYRSSQKVKDEVSLSGQWTNRCDSQVVMKSIPLICRSATVHKKTNVSCYSRAHGSGGRRRRALCKSGRPQGRLDTQVGRAICRRMQVAESRGCARSQPTSQQPTFSAFVGQVRAAAKVQQPSRPSTFNSLYISRLRRSPHPSRFLHIAHPVTPPHSSTTPSILNPLPSLAYHSNTTSFQHRFERHLSSFPPLVHRFFFFLSKRRPLSSHCIA